MEGQKATAARAAQERAALSKVDRIRSENAARAETLEREAAEAEQKARALGKQCVATMKSSFQKVVATGPAYSAIYAVVILLAASLHLQSVPKSESCKPHSLPFG